MAVMHHRFLLLTRRFRAVPLAVACLTVLAMAARPVPVQAADLSTVCQRLQERVRAFDGRVGFAVTDTNSGQQCLYHEAEIFDSASLYKLVVMAEAYRQVSLRTLSMTDNLRVGPEHAIDDPPELRDRDPVNIPIADALRLMIEVSDNATAVALTERLGLANIQREARRLGMTHTELGPAFTTTAADINILMMRLYTGEVVSRDASQNMLAMMRHQFYGTRIPAKLPASAVVANKTGSLRDYVHDTGVVWAPYGTYAITVLTQAGSGVDLATAEELIQDLAGTVYGAYVQIPETGGPTVVTASVPKPAASTVVVRDARGLTPDAGMSDAAARRGVLALPRRAGAGDSLLFATLLAAVAPLVWFYGRARRPAALVQSGTVAYPAGYAVHGGGQEGWEQGRLIAQLDPLFRAQSPVEVDMPFGGRSQRDRDAISPEYSRERVTRDEMDMAAVDVPYVEVIPPAAAPVVHSTRLRRLGEYFAAHSELLAEMRRQTEAETAPFQQLLNQQAETSRYLVQSLDLRLRPLLEYAVSEEQNLAALEEEMASQGMEFIARSFSDYVAQQRLRIRETRSHIEMQRAPYQAHSDAQREAIEMALSRFDEDVAMLEHNLAEQRKIMMRMLDAMRSEAFVAAREYLAAREAEMRESARAGITDPAAITMRLREAGAQLSGVDSTAYLERLVQHVQSTDERFAQGTGIAPDAGSPRSIARPPAPEPGVSGDERIATG